MILYYGVTSYHVLCCMLHKMKWNTNEEALLYISNTHPECEKLIEAVKTGNIFSDVDRFPDKGRMLPFKKKYGKNPDREQLMKLTQQLCQEIERDLPFDPNKMKEYNICGDQYGLGIWLIRKGKEYNYFEEGCGVYTRSHLLLENLKRLNPFQHDLALEYQCMGQNKKIKKKFVEFSYQEGIFDKEHCVDFSVKNILKELSQEELSQVLGVFQVPEEKHGEKESVLLLTQQFVNMGFLTVEQEKEMYDYMLDFFAPEASLYVKPHPSDWQGLYKKWYPEATVFERFMPSELLPYVIDRTFSKGITVSSTSIFGLEPYLEDVVCLDSSFEDAYTQLLKYYVAGELVKTLEHADVKVRYEGEFSRLFDTMTQDICSHGEKEVLISSQCKCSNADLIIYLNPENKDVLLEEWMEQDENIVPLPIEIIDMETGREEIEFIFCYCKDEELRKILADLEVGKVLEKSKKEIVVEQEYYKRKCLALEGMLRATNQRVEALKQKMK
ncbi:MAG: glycosyltransferase family 52 [Anaerostipes sp.]|jgi:hypothetical protein